MPTWRGIGILVIFVTIGEKHNFYPPSPTPARDAETHKRRTHAAAESAEERQTRNFDNLRQLCWQFLLISFLVTACWLIVLDWTVEQQSVWRVCFASL